MLHLLRIASVIHILFLFFFNHTATTQIYTFPYTTLFRSSVALAAPNEIAVREKMEQVVVVDPIRTCSDRKSTRLNSSHTVISYAVFCLKKKKKKKQQKNEKNRTYKK